MKLREFFEKHGIRYTPWAKEHNIPVSCVHRHLEGKGYFKPVTARKIYKAAGGEVDLFSLCPDLAEPKMEPAPIAQNA